VPCNRYTSFAFTSRLLEAGVDASVGSVGDGYDNALPETTIGVFKTEKINRDGPWKTVAEVELATLEWVDWYNHARLRLATAGRVRTATPSSARDSITLPPRNPGRFTRHAGFAWGPSGMSRPWLSPAGC
jgi:transposase InsO family protein